MWWLLAAASTPTVDLGPAIQQIGIGVLIAAPAYFTSWLLWKRSDSQQAEIKVCSADRVKDKGDQVIRERELADRLAPLLAEAVKILSAAPEKFDSALNQAQNTMQRNEMEALLRQVKTAIDTIPESRRQ